MIRVNKLNPTPTQKKIGIGIFIFLVAAVTLTLCTRSSFLYPINNWVDANCFFTVGKSMLRGLVPYRDLIEQKGPVLYMIHALGALISWDSFFGVYLLEVAAAFVYLYFSYKSVHLFLGNYSLLTVIPLAVLTYTMKSFALGDSAEEFCLPMLAYLVWVGLKSLREEKVPGKMEFFLIGCISGLVLWIKYIMLGFYLGWFLPFFFLFLKKRQIRELMVSIGMILLGVGAVSLPVLIYFAWNGALTDLFMVYFYNNIFNYTWANEFGFWGMVNNLRANLISGIGEIKKGSAPAFWLFWIGAAWLVVRRKLWFGCYAFLMAAFGVLGIYSTVIRFEYYSQAFACLMVFGLIAAGELVLLLSRSRKEVCIAIGLCATLYYATKYPKVPNLGWMAYEKEDLPQYQFAEIINQKEDATLLNYGFLDGGFYTAAGLVPNCPMFCLLNVNHDENLELQTEYLRQGLVDFVVTYDQELELSGYRLAMQSEAYRLYEKIEPEAG